MSRWLLLLTLLGSGCRVVVIGDSNTCGVLTGCLDAEDHRVGYYWPARLVKLPGWPRWTVENQGVPGMTAGDYRVCADNVSRSCMTDEQCGTGVCAPLRLADGHPSSGLWRLEQLIARYSGWHFCAWPGAVRPKLVIAVGTNDLGAPTHYETGAAVLTLYDRARQAQPCVEVYVATIPPRLTVDPAKTAGVNATIIAGLAGRGAGARVIPFGAAPQTDLGHDGTHITDAGQQRRAELALPVLFPR